MLQRIFVAAFFGTLLYVTLSQHLLPSGESWGPRVGPFADLFAGSEAPAPAGLVAASRRLEGRLDDLERRLEDASHLRAVALSGVQVLLAAGGAGNETVYVGREDWLILRAGFDYLTGPPFLDPRVLERRRRAAPSWEPKPEPDPRPAILDFHRQLAARGIRLMILPAPTQPMIHPESLRSGLAASPAGLQNPSFDAFRRGLEAAGVIVVDPVPPLLENLRQTGREQYLRTDSHWSPEAVDAVARALADRIRSMGPSWAGAPLTWRRRTTTLEGVGDLERSLMLPGWQNLYTPQSVELQQVTTRRGRPWRPDPRAEILLLGDSFTNVYSDSSTGWGTGAGLAEQLSFHLERPVDRIAINAGGVAASRRRLAARLAGKKVVVWQFAIRELAVGDWEPQATISIRGPRSP